MKQKSIKICRMYCDILHSLYFAAVESLSAMESCSSEDASSSEEDCVSGLICLAAQLAFEVRLHSWYMVVLLR